MARRIGRSAVGATIASLTAIGCATILGIGDVPTPDDGGLLADGRTTSPKTGSSPPDADGATADIAMADGGRPALGPQLDRVGRPGISSLYDGIVLGTFEDDPSAASALRAQYSADSDEKGWVSRYAPAIAKSLALYDGIALAITIEVDPLVLLTHGKILSAWASTNRRP